MNVVNIVMALLPIAEKVWNLIARAVAGEKLSAEQIKSEMEAAVADADTRLARLPADIANNNAIVDAELIKGDEETPK